MLQPFSCHYMVCLVAGVVTRDDSVGAVMYVHIPTPGPAEDVVRPLPDRVSSTFRRTWRHLSSSDFLGGNAPLQLTCPFGKVKGSFGSSYSQCWPFAGHAAKIERQQLARGAASSLEALHEMPVGPHGEAEATAELEVSLSRVTLQFFWSRLSNLHRIKSKQPDINFNACSPLCDNLRGGGCGAEGQRQGRGSDSPCRPPAKAEQQSCGCGFAPDFQAQGTAAARPSRDVEQAECALPSQTLLS